MARGFIYEAAKDPALLNHVSAAHFYDDTDLIGCDFVSDEFDKERCIYDFLCTLKLSGFSVDYESKSFVLNNKDKLRYFEERFKKLKWSVDNMTLKDFCFGNLLSSNLQNLVEDKYGDCIYESTPYGNSIITMDQWIRAAGPGTYFLGGVVLMR